MKSSQSHKQNKYCQKAIGKNGAAGFFNCLVSEFHIEQPGAVEQHHHNNCQNKTYKNEGIEIKALYKMTCYEIVKTSCASAAGAGKTESCRNAGHRSSDKLRDDEICGS